MTEPFTPQVQALLDRLEPPALTADFANRVLARADAMPALPPLPRLRKPGWRRGRRIALTLGIAGLVSVAAAAAVVPAEVWRRIPLIGELVELIAPARTDPDPPPERIDEGPVAPTASEVAVPDAAPPAEREILSVADAGEVAPAEEPGVVEAPSRAEVAPSAARPEPIERLREAPPQPERATPVAERPLPEETRPATATAVVRPAERAPERIAPAETRETRQQTRERATDTRQATRERTERRERRANRAN